MERKRLIAALIGVAAVLIGGYYVAGHRAESEVDRLIREAHARGIKTQMNAIATQGADRSTAAFNLLVGIERNRDLRTLRFDEAMVPAAKRFLVGAESYFGPIAEFAALDVYSPNRDYSAGMVVPEYSTLAIAEHVEGWRGYVLAKEGAFDEAVESTRILRGLMDRLHDEGFPIGNAIAVRAQVWISRILLELAEQNADSAERLESLKEIAESIPAHDFRNTISSELSGSLQYLDEVQAGKLEATDPKYIFGVEYRLPITPQRLDRIRASLLRMAIQTHDTWNSAPLSIHHNAASVVIDDDFQRGLLESMDSSVQIARWYERNDLAARRALLLALDAHVLRRQTGQMPSIHDLEGKGIDVTDPWTGMKMSLHAEGKRIWVGGVRPSRSTPQAPDQVVDLAEWRP